MTRIYWLTVGILVVWRVTHFCVAEDGPWDIMAHLRRRGARFAFWRKLVGCFYCLSLWIALPLAAGLGENWMERVLLWPALSAGAILLERATDNEPALWREDPEPSSGSDRTVDDAFQRGDSAAAGGDSRAPVRDVMNTNAATPMSERPAVVDSDRTWQRPPAR